MAGTFQIHFFSTATSYTGKPSESLPAPLPLSALFDTLEERYPGIREGVLGSCSVAVDGEYVDVESDGLPEGEGKKIGGVGREDVNKDEGSVDDPGTAAGGNGRVIQAGEEVAIIPPVSSG